MALNHAKIGGKASSIVKTFARYRGHLGPSGPKLEKESKRPRELIFELFSQLRARRAQMTPVAGKCFPIKQGFDSKSTFFFSTRCSKVHGCGHGANKAPTLKHKVLKCTRNGVGVLTMLIRCSGMAFVCVCVCV